jgi:hypothetical protein
MQKDDGTEEKEDGGAPTKKQTIGEILRTNRGLTRRADHETNESRFDELNLIFKNVSK